MSDKHIAMRLYEFEPVIYPRTLWVMKGGTAEDVKKAFLDSGGGELDFGERDDIGAWTCDVTRREDGRYGVLVWFPGKITVNIMAHEATHAMFYLCGALGLEADSENNEHLAYLMGWICDRMDSVRRGKAKNTF